MFLTEDAVEELTGYKQWAAQARWLKRNRVPFTRQRVTGRPIVLASALTEKRIGGEIAVPELDWIRARKKAA